MIRPFKKPRFSRFPVFIVLLLSCALIQIASAGRVCLALSDRAGIQVETEDLQIEFLELKKKFELDAKKVKEQKILTTMALETTARSWALAASFLGADERGARLKKSTLDKAVTSKNWETRELAALEYYYEAILSLTMKIAQKNNQKTLLDELEAIIAETAEQLEGLGAKPEGALEKRAVLSGGLTGIMAVAVKSVGGGAMEQPIQLIVKEMLSRANAISARPDIHYRAKLYLLYVNNVQGLTALTFLLGHNAGPPLSGELAKVHSAWNAHVENANLPDTLSLTWTAHYQAVLPLAFWLATH